MKEEYIFLKIGGKMLKLTKITYQEYMKNLRLDSKYLIYFNGDHYYKLPKMGTEEARRSQLVQSWDRIIEIRQERFIRHFSWLAIYTYNMILDFKKKVPLPISQWFRAIQGYLTSKSISDFERHAISKINVTLSPKIIGKNRIDNLLIGSIKDFAWLWISELTMGKINLCECAAPDCFKIFINAGGKQKYCTRRCKSRTNDRRYKAEEKKKEYANK